MIGRSVSKYIDDEPTGIVPPKKEKINLMQECMKEFERAKNFGIREINWLPFKQAWFKAYRLGQENPKL